MICMENKDGIEVSRYIRVWLHARELPQEIFGMREHAIRSHGRKAFAYPVPSCHYGGDPGDKPDSYINVCFARLRFQLGIGHCEERNSSLQHIHWAGTLGQQLQTFKNKAGDIPCFS